MAIKLKKGDTVQVLCGKDKGKKGKILRMVPGGKVVVERINIVKKHQRQTQKMQGGIVEKPLALSASKVMLVCPKCNAPSRVKMVDISESKVRSCVRCSEAIDKV